MLSLGGCCQGRNGRVFWWQWQSGLLRASIVDVGITFWVADIAISGTDYGNINSDYKKEGSNTNSTRTLVNPRLVDI
jgi:hypothetical protein